MATIDRRRVVRWLLVGVPDSKALMSSDRKNSPMPFVNVRKFQFSIVQGRRRVRQALRLSPGPESAACRLLATFRGPSDELGKTEQPD